MTGSIFSNIQKTVFATTETVFGYLATWEPSIGGDAVTERVLLQNPTEQMTTAGVDYDPDAWRMEFGQNQFVGLKQLADSRATNEKITIEGNEFLVAKVFTKFDGNTLVAILSPL